ncbi:hypothetical protein HELRODRAFT_178825 [Helobdella robusta]|uniref:DUF4590 domain-containing protein n=1 Tax=Helobdella robusta TaxID=6412 RepID=T1FDS7_HELRO|nr:hypothetical protein HELRODRAFT_178825 [Helobdella robusta]ESN95909.1 hypothetical protein HELRODRAFT_178825 [Helobdella robusta]
METYNSLTDPHLFTYFSNDRKKDDLKKAGLLTKDGGVVSEATYKLNAIMSEKKIKGFNVTHDQQQIDGKYRQSTYHSMMSSARNKYPPWIGSSPYNWPIPMPHNDILKVRISGGGHKCTGYLTYNTLPAIKRGHDGSPCRNEIQVSGTLQIIPKTNNLHNRPTNSNAHNNTNNNNNKPCYVTMRYYGDAIQLSNSWMVRRDEVVVEQQHCGGSTITVFKDKLCPGSDFTFVSTRHSDYPFSLTIYVDYKQNTRVSVCCEAKHRKGVRLGGNSGMFGIVSVRNPRFCEKCSETRKRRKLEKKMKRKNKTKNDVDNKEDEENNNNDDDIDDVITAMKDIHDDDDEDDAQARDKHTDDDDEVKVKNKTKKPKLKKKKKIIAKEEPAYDDDFEKESDDESGEMKDGDAMPSSNRDVYSVLVKSESSTQRKNENTRDDQDNDNDSDKEATKNGEKEEDAELSDNQTQKLPRKKVKSPPTERKLSKKNSNINKREIQSDDDDVTPEHAKVRRSLSKKQSNATNKTLSSDKIKTNPESNKELSKKEKMNKLEKKEEHPKLEKRKSKMLLKNKSSSMKNETRLVKLNENEEDTKMNDDAIKKDSSRDQRSIQKSSSVRSTKSEILQSDRSSISKNSQRSIKKVKSRNPFEDSQRHQLNKTPTEPNIVEDDQDEQEDSENKSDREFHADPENLDDREEELQEKEAYEKKLKDTARQCVMDVYRSLETSMLDDDDVNNNTHEANDKSD